MTDLADRIIPQQSSEPPSIKGLADRARVRDAGAEHGPVGRPAAVFLSVLSGSIAMLAVGAALGEDRPRAATAILIIVAWLELLVAVLIIARPSESLVFGTLALNTSLVIAWAVSAAVGSTSASGAIMLTGVCVAGAAVLTTLAMLLR